MIRPPPATFFTSIWKRTWRAVDESSAMRIFFTGIAESLHLRGATLRSTRRIAAGGSCSGRHMHLATHGAGGSSLNRLAFSATVHCLTGCSIGEVLGMVIGTAWGWSNSATILISIGLAFMSGYGLTLLPLLRAGMGLVAALGLALASDTISITIMEIVDNAVVLLIPGAMDAGLTDWLFWASLAVSLVLAGVAAFPANPRRVSPGPGHRLGD